MDEVVRKTLAAELERQRKLLRDADENIEGNKLWAEGMARSRAECAANVAALEAALEEEAVVA